MEVKPEELRVKDARTYPHRSYVSTVDNNRQELDKLSRALREAVIVKAM